MSHSSTKNHLVINLLVWACLCLPLSSLAAKYEFKLDFDAKYGTHVYGLPSTATNRHSIAYEQKIEFDSNWTSLLGFRAEVESAYAAVPERYGSGNVAKIDSQTFFPRDNYIQYQGGIFRARAGYQQVVWGEAFGYYYADIVNPKDYREAGLGNLSQNRLNTPILNLQWIFSSNSIQVLYMPTAGYSLMPSSGSDFNINKPSGTLASYPIIIEREPLNPLTRAEYGLRFTQQYSPMDFSLFYLNYYDRFPIYQYQINPLTAGIVAKPDFRPLQTQGATVTIDYDGYLFRSEILKHTDRELNMIDGTNIAVGKTNETISVFGIDFPMVNKWLIAIQYSESLLEEKSTWARRPRMETIASVRISKTFSNNLIFETLLTDYTQDSSTLLQSQVTIPISNQNEVIFGADRFEGGDATAFGSLKNASRVWLMFKATLKR